jgi:hypothetical protein
MSPRPRKKRRPTVNLSSLTSAMRDGVWDRTASYQNEYKEYSALRRDDGGNERHLPTFKSGFSLRTCEARGAIVADLQ